MQNGAAHTSSLRQWLPAFTDRNLLFFSFKSSFRQVISFKYSPNVAYSIILCLSSGLVTHASRFYLEGNTISFLDKIHLSLSCVHSTDLCRGRMEEGDTAVPYRSTDCPLLQHCLILNIFQTSADIIWTICSCWNSQ